MPFLNKFFELLKMFDGIEIWTIGSPVVTILVTHGLALFCSKMKY